MPVAGFCSTLLSQSLVVCISTWYSSILLHDSCRRRISHGLLAKGESTYPMTQSLRYILQPEDPQASSKQVKDSMRICLYFQAPSTLVILHIIVVSHLVGILVEAVTAYCLRQSGGGPRSC